MFSKLKLSQTHKCTHLTTNQTPQIKTCYTSINLPGEKGKKYNALNTLSSG